MAGIPGLDKALQAGAAYATSEQQAREARTGIQRKAVADVAATKRTAAMATPEVINSEVEAERARTQQIIDTQARTESYDAFRAYTADSNPKHLNRMLKNPALRELYGEVSSVDKLDLTQDQQLLQREGVDLTKLNDPAFDKAAMLHRILKVTLPDGSKKLIDTQQLMIASGYANYANQQDIDAMMQRSQIFKNLRGDKGVPSTMEKKAGFISEQTGEPLDAVTKRLYEKEVSGVTPGKLEMADRAEASLEETFGKKFFGTDFAKRENRTRASKYIRQIEQAGGEELAAADRADLKDISTLIASGITVAKELTTEATGVLDNFTGNVRKYLDDAGVAETEGRAAYNAYRNALLRSFGGTAMSDSEVRNFNAAFGTLAQKYPAVIAQFKQAIGQTKAKLETIARLNNPYLAHYYLGSSQDDVDIISTRLDETLSQLRQHENRGKAPNAKGAEQKDWRNLWAKDKK